MNENILHINNTNTDLIYHICVNLNIQSHIFHSAVFTKQFFSIHNLAHLFLQKNRQKSNKLNFSPQQIGVLSALFAHLTSVQSKAQACRSIVFYSLFFNLIHTSIK